VGGVWRVKNFWKLSRSAWAMWCATGKFSNFKNFAADSKMFKKNPAFRFQFYFVLFATINGWMPTNFFWIRCTPFSLPRTLYFSVTSQDFIKFGEKNSFVFA
jgi:hypothetical protein